MSAAGIFWIASYPKSGNTWVRCLIASLLAGGGTPDLARLGTPTAANRNWLERVLSVPVEDLTQEELTGMRAEAHRLWASIGSGPRCLKVHDGYRPDLFPPALTAGAVYIVRDPRDVAPSWGAHMTVPVDRAIADMGRADMVQASNSARYQTDAPQALGSWSQHVLSWLDGPRPPPLLLRYEDMLADPPGQAARLAAHLGLAADRTAVAGAVAACRFDRLQAAEAAEGFVERPDKMARFFRQGRAGAWRSALTAGQAARIEADHGGVMARLGYLGGA